MTTLEGAFIREQGVEFAVVIVKSHVLSRKAEADKLIGALRVRFRVPVLLMAQDADGVPTWYGRRDLSRFTSRSKPSPGSASPCTDEAPFRVSPPLIPRL